MVSSGSTRKIPQSTVSGLELHLLAVVDQDPVFGVYWIVLVENILVVLGVVARTYTPLTSGIPAPATVMLIGKLPGLGLLRASSFASVHKEGVCDKHP